MKTRAMGYIRVSTMDQVEEGHSLYAQRTAIEQFCKAKGWELVEIKVDAGISGTKNDRPALTALLQAAEQGRLDVVVVHAIDRFYRDLQGLLSALNRLRQCDVTFISITENLDFSTPWGKLALAVLGTLAEVYVDRLRQETRKGKQARAAKGLHNGSPPLGYCRGNCSSCTDPNGPGYCPRYGGPNIQDYTPSLPLVQHPIEREIVRRAFELYVTGQYSDGEIAEILNGSVYTLPDGTQVRFRTKGRHGRGQPERLCKDSIRDLLQHPFYAGLVPHYGVNEKGQKRKRRDAVTLYPGQHEPIVDQTLFEQCCKVRALMSTNPRLRPDVLDRIYTLSGILYCGYCGQPMRAHSSQGVRYYQDRSRIQHLADCPQSYVLADEIEEQFGQLLQAICLPPDWRERVLATLWPDLDARKIAEQEIAARARLERAKRLYIDGDIGDAEYAREKLEYEAKLADLRPVEYCAILTVGAILEATPFEWCNLMPLQKKERSRTLFTTVLVRGTRLLAAKPTDACYALIQTSVGFRAPFLRVCRKSGSDGI